MRTRSSQLLFSLIFSVVFVNLTLGADISLKSKDVVSSRLELKFNGEMQIGDAGKLDAILVANDSNSFRNVIVNFSSPGGSYDERLKIAELLHSKNIASYIGEGASCFSACPTAFLGGSALGAENISFIARGISPKAKLGFHAPYLVVPGNNYSKAAVEEAYTIAVRQMAKLIEKSALLGIEPKVLPQFLVKGPAEFKAIGNADDLGVWRISESPSRPPPSLTISMIANACSNSFRWKTSDSALNRSSLIGPDGSDGWRTKSLR